MRRPTSVLAAGALAVLAATALAGCGTTDEVQASAAPAKPTGGLISIIVNDPSNPYWKTEGDVAAAEAKRLGYSAAVSASKGKVQAETVLMETAIEAHSVAIVLDPADSTKSITEVQKAQAAGIPVFLVNSQINADGVAKAQLYSDNEQGAIVGDTEFARRMGASGTYDELLGAPTDNNADIRSDGYRKVLSKAKAMHREAVGTADWDRGKGQDQMVAMLRSKGAVKGVIAGNDEMAIGAVTALKQAGKFEGVVVGGFDGSPDAVAAVKSGDLAYTLLQPVAIFSKAAIDMADVYVRTGTLSSPTERQAFKCLLITKANADRYTAAFTLS